MKKLQLIGAGFVKKIIIISHHSFKVEVYILTILESFLLPKPVSTSYSANKSIRPSLPLSQIRTYSPKTKDRPKSPS